MSWRGTCRRRRQSATTATGQQQKTYSTHAASAHTPTTRSEQLVQVDTVNHTYELQLKIFDSNIPLKIKTKSVQPHTAQSSNRLNCIISTRHISLSSTISRIPVCIRDRTLEETPELLLNELQELATAACRQHALVWRRSHTVHAVHQRQLCTQHTSGHCQSITLPPATDSCCHAAAGVKQAASHGLEGQVITARRAALQVLTDTSQQHVCSEQREGQSDRCICCVPVPMPPHNIPDVPASCSLIYIPNLTVITFRRSPSPP